MIAVSRSKWRWLRGARKLATCQPLSLLWGRLDEVMANQADLVEVVAELRAVMCVKG
jgi:hypothetical protein